jgi:hypothetical protein
MPIGGYTSVQNSSLIVRGRQLLPGDRQNIPLKSLKNKENSAPDFFHRRVQ